MLPYEEIVAEAIRLEIEEKTGKLYIVFEVTNEKYKQSLKRDWVNDLEFKIINKKLVKEE